MEFSPQLAAYLIATKWVYSKINLKDIGKLQSKYALRFYEIALSYSSMAGKANNRYDSWYFERTIEELRFIFGIPNDTYKTKKDFKKNVIEKPIEEINKANIGLKITVKEEKQHPKTKCVRFNCQKTLRKLPAPQKTPETIEQILPEEPDNLPEINLEEIRKKYGDNLADIYEHLLATGEVLNQKLLDKLMGKNK
jgi:plasmid replication initiation protein